jgi:hypothetical protein
MSKIVEAIGKTSRYDADFYEWAKEQAAALRERHYELLDFENLAEEIEGLARSDRRELRSRVVQILVHLLKCQFQPGRRSRSWEATLASQRTEIEAVVRDSPSLRREVPELITDAYASARRIAAKEIRLEQLSERFPMTCPWSVEQVLDPDFYPAPAE